ncbi:MAG: chemotaxis protein CheX [Thermodesulfobacteriota bacterium]|nr:chemotaxis protein CheX [Thermodesulfobacteriota bacterium]
MTDKKMMKAAMKDSISEVLETMFFLPLDFPSAGDSDEQSRLSDTDKTITAKLEFRGSLAGCFVLSIPEASALSMTADFLGVDTSHITEEQTNETVKEIINMIAGSTFRNYNAQLVFDLGIPEVVHLDEIWKSGAGNQEEILALFNTLEDQLALKMVWSEGPGPSN